MIKGKISVVIPVFNGEMYLNRCIQSVVNQTYKNLEIIIVDDGSTDNSGSICDAWKQTDERIVVIHTSNGGVSRARNIALDFAQGEYIAFVDADDWIDVDMYACMIEAMQRTGVDICAGGHVLSLHNKEIVTYENSVSKQLSRNEALAAMYSGKTKKNLGWELCDKLFKSFLFSGLRFNCSIKTAEDNLLFWQLMKRVNKIYQLPLNKYYYFMREDSAVHTINIKRILDNVHVARYIYRDASTEIAPVIDGVRLRYYITLISAIRKLVLYFNCTEAEKRCIRAYSNIIRKNILFILEQKCDCIYKLSAFYAILPFKMKLVMKKLMGLYKTRENLY